MGTDPFPYPWILCNYFRDKKHHYRLVPQIKQAGSSTQTEPRMTPVSRAATWETSLTILLVQDEKSKMNSSLLPTTGLSHSKYTQRILFPTQEWARACYDRKDRHDTEELSALLPPRMPLVRSFLLNGRQKGDSTLAARDFWQNQLKPSSSSPWAQDTWTCFQGSQSQV